MNEQAKTVIEICGGFRRVAELTGRDETRVRRWTYEKARGGTGGLIPSDVQQDLMVRARAAGVLLLPEHFFPAPLPPVVCTCAGDVTAPRTDRGAA